MSTTTVLSLDGGGVRGLFALSLLMHYRQANQGKKLSETFGAIVGCSAGSILGALIAFGHLDEGPYEGPDGLSKLLESVPGVFSGGKPFAPLFDTLYDGTGKRKALVKIFGEETTFGACPTRLVVCTTNLSTGQPALFDTAEETHKDTKLVDILDASSAAPLAFPAVEIDGGLYLDGCLHFNNPLLVALKTVMEEEKGGDPKSRRRILSIGSAQPPPCSLENYLRRGYGLCSLLSNNLVGNMVLGSDAFLEALVKKVLGNSRVLRITATDYYRMDDFSSLDHIKKDAANKWTQCQNGMTDFIAGR